MSQVPENRVQENLEAPAEFHSWWRRMLTDGMSDREVLEALREDASDMSLCRQLVVAYHGGLADERTELIERCLNTADVRVQLYAKSLDAYTQIAWYDAPDGAYNSPASALIPGLRGDLQKLEALPPSPFNREVSCSVYIALGVGSFLQGHINEALVCASNAWYWAARLKAPFCIERARSLQIAALVETGQVGEALTVLQASDAATAAQTAATRAYYVRVQAYLLSQVGRYEEAVALLYDYRLGREETNTPIESELQRTRLLWGTGGLDGEIVQAFDASDLEGQLSSSLRKILGARAQPSWGAGRTQRQRLINEALELWAKPRQPLSFSWARGMGSWVQAVGSLWLDRPDLAANSLDDWRSPSEQSLDLNLLHAGAQLETTLHLKQPGVGVEVWLERLRAVFREARSRRVASPEGLAYRLSFWHPLAAAFAAVAPGGVRELKGSVSAVLEVGARSRVYGIDLPPLLASELALRALGFDNNRSVSFIQADVGRDRKKRNALQAKRGDLTFYRPVLSAVSLIYGLVKLDELERARSIYADYGVSPKSTAEYKMQPVLENVDRAVQALLNKELSVEAFSYAVLADERI